MFRPPQHWARGNIFERWVSDGISSGLIKNQGKKSIQKQIMTGLCAKENN
jgi:hypothetical protein